MIKRIHYTKDRLKSNLRYGLALIIVGLLIFLYINLTDNQTPQENPDDSSSFGLIGGGIFMLSLYFYEKRYQYLTIKDGYIYKSWWPFNKLTLSDIKQVEKSNNKYILLSDNKKLSISIETIEKKSLLELERILNLK